jgi:Leucine-rich repeat (LRR) protein
MIKIMNENIQKAINRIEASLNERILDLSDLNLTNEDLIYIFNIEKYQGYFANLKGLDLYSNEIESLPGNIFDKFVNLVYLDLSHNKFKSLPGNILDKLVNLKLLFLVNTNLKNIPEIVFLKL